MDILLTVKKGNAMRKKSYRQRKRARQIRRELAQAIAIALAMIPLAYFFSAIGFVLRANMAAQIL